MPLIDYVALISLTSRVPARRLMEAAAALQKQVTRDFGPVWGIQATVDAFEDLTSVPNDYYHVIVFGDPVERRGRVEQQIGEPLALRLIDAFEGKRLQGIHVNTFTRQPFALVMASDDDAWTVAVSHEVLERPVDPFGNRLVAAAHPRTPDQRVKYLVEVCDPCQSAWYTVNGVRVSDFYTPRYFDPVSVDVARYSFTGSLRYPLDILDGGYARPARPARLRPLPVPWGNHAAGAGRGPCGAFPEHRATAGDRGRGSHDAADRVGAAVAGGLRQGGARRQPGGAGSRAGHGVAHGRGGVVARCRDEPLAQRADTGCH